MTESQTVTIYLGGNSEILFCVCKNILSFYMVTTYHGLNRYTTHTHAHTKVHAHTFLTHTRIHTLSPMSNVRHCNSYPPLSFSLHPTPPPPTKAAPFNVSIS